MTSRRFPLALAATMLATLGVGAWAQSAAAPAAKPVIIGYLFPGNELIVPSDIAADKLTHINYAFADVKDGRVVEGFGRDAENFKLLADLRRQHPHLQILISVGGWTWSGNFSDAALTPRAVVASRTARSSSSAATISTASTSTGSTPACAAMTTCTGRRTSRTSPR